MLENSIDVKIDDFILLRDNMQKIKIKEMHFEKGNMK